MAKDLGDDFGSDFSGDDFKASAGGSKIKWENIIPIAVIVIVLALILFKTNVFSGGLPFTSTGTGSNILVIGSPSVEFKNVLYDPENKDLIKQVRFVNIESIERNPKEAIKGYNIIILDQSLQTDKSITRRVGDALKSYVNSGGKLIVVLNSGIERPGDISVLGWQANLGNIVPVSCDKIIFGTPSCKKEYFVQGIIYRAFDHPIMDGIERAPALDSSGLYNTSTFDVSVLGREIAYLEDARTGQTFPAIVEKSMIMGKVIYFNYNPGLSKAIFVNTLKYLR
jgi:hypothetical protein